jgi:1-acyl-sn-glycerol-3-phosphate acyltransferase
MLKATKSAWFESIFRLYNRNLLRRRFASLRIRNLQALSAQELPTIVIANHTSWWDGLVCFEILKRARADAYVLMEEKNLRKYPLFRRLGAIPIDRDNPRRALETLTETANFLREDPGKSLLVFPQGKIESTHARPIEFESGVVKLIERTLPCRVVPLALSYEFRDEFKPEIFANAGEIFFAAESAPRASAPDLSVILEQSLDAQIERIKLKLIDEYVECLP